MIFFKSTQSRTDNGGGGESLLNSIDFAALGAGSKVAAILLILTRSSEPACSNGLALMVLQSTQIAGM